MSQTFPAVMDGKQCAEFLHMKSDREVLRLAREGRLPSVKVGKHVLFVTDEVVAHLRRLQRPGVTDRELERGKRLGLVAESTQ